MKCPHCGEILSDVWFRREMQKRKSQMKERQREVGSANARKMWQRRKGPGVHVDLIIPEENL
jgi:hypothetical protein